MKLLLSILLFIVLVQADTIIKPYDSIEATGDVVDMVVSNDMLVISTDKGSIESYDLKTKNLLSRVEFPMIKDFMGDAIYPKVFSTDYLKKSDQYLAVVQASNGSRELFVIKNGVKNRLIDSKERLFISKAKFINKDQIMVALLSNEYILFNIKNREKLYRIHVNYSHFSDFMLNETKSILAGSCESGEIALLNVKSGKIIKTLKGGNLDNVYKVDFKKSRVLCAGQDRRGIVYDVESGSYIRFDGHFLIYAGALSPSAKRGAFAFTEDNDIVVFDLLLEKRVFTLRGQKSTLNSIIFLDENRLISGSDDKHIMLWKLK